jgi:hypothetical protein
MDMINQARSQTSGITGMDIKTNSLEITRTLTAEMSKISEGDESSNDSSEEETSSSDDEFGEGESVKKKE